MKTFNMGGTRGGPDPLEHYSLLYVSLVIMVRPPREAIGPLGSNCLLREVRTHWLQKSFQGHPQFRNFLDPRMFNILFLIFWRLCGIWVYVSRLWRLCFDMRGRQWLCKRNWCFLQGPLLRQPTLYGRCLPFYLAGMRNIDLYAVYWP